MKKNLSDRNVLEKNESQQIERFKTSKKFKNPEIQESSGKFSDSKKKSKLKLLINENPLDNNINNDNNQNYENEANKDNDNTNENDNSKMKHEKNIDEDSNNNNTKNNINNNNINNIKNINKDEHYHGNKKNENFKLKQNAFTQVDFWKEIVEEKIKNIILEYEEKEKEMKLKISDLLKNIQNIKSENFKLILVLKTKLNEKNQEINNLKILNDTLMKQLAKLKDNKNNINNKLINKTNSNEPMNSNNNFISDYYNKNIIKQSDMINHKIRYRNDIIENDIKDMNICQKRAPTFIMHKSLNFQNKNKSKDNILKDTYGNNRYKVNKSKNNILRLKVERMEPNVFLKSISYCKSGETFKKIQSDFSIKVDNNLFTKKMKNKEKRLLSAKLLNIKDYSNVNKSQFRKTFFKLKLI